MNNKLSNPIIPGFYPDPSICNVGDDYYIACSSFELCPGLPIFHSKDLANWEQIGYALTADNGFHVEKNGMVGGLMAPTIRYCNGNFYIINANFSDRGNYIIKATNPAGPWSAPHYLDDVPGIDASIFFDEDGTCYIMGTGNVWDNGAGEMERGIWLAKYDIENYKMLSEPVCIFNSALRNGASPESPHIYHRGDYYYLIIAEGGTEHYHSVMVARSKDIFGFYEGYPANPVLTHRHMGFKAPITNVGHADLVELPDGSWYAVFLASRLIEGECKNLGRETFICPVVWERDWPLFSPETGKVEWEYDAPKCLPWSPVEDEISFDDFNDDNLALPWSVIGTPYDDFYRIEASNLIIKCGKNPLNTDIRQVGWEPQFLKDTYLTLVARRQRKINQAFSCKMSFAPENNEAAGVCIMQAMNHIYMVEKALQDGKSVIRVKLSYCEFDIPPYIPGFSSTTREEIIVAVPWEKDDIVIKILIEGEKFTVLYGEGEDDLKELAIVDGHRINPEKVGCMVGTMLGMFATANGIESTNEAAFDWCNLV